MTHRELRQQFLGWLDEFNAYWADKPPHFHPDYDRFLLVSESITKSFGRDNQVLAA